MALHGKKSRSAGLSWRYDLPVSGPTPPLLQKIPLHSGSGDPIEEVRGAACIHLPRGAENDVPVRLSRGLSRAKRSRGTCCMIVGRAGAPLIRAFVRPR